MQVLSAVSYYDFILHIVMIEEMGCMAKTSGYNNAEDWVRETALKGRFGQPFYKKRIVIGQKSDGTDADHEFDAVSSDGNIITSIKAHSGKTSGNKNPVGKITSAFTEVLFLSMVQEGEKRYLILTDPAFYKIFQRKADGKLPKNVGLMHIPLPVEIQERVDNDKQTAITEMSKI